MSTSDPFDGPGEYFPPLLRAIHKLRRGCGKSVAVYRNRAGGWELTRKCRCTPQPELPAGQELDGWLARARLGRTRPVDV